MKKSASGTVTLYHYDYAGNLISETDGNGTPLRDYVYLNGERIAMRVYGSQAGWYYFVNDHLGTPQKIADSSGNIVWEAAYLPFGEAQLVTETVANNFRFPGQYFDAETGLHYNWHRYYDPKTGRYLTPDPIGLEGGINLFGYALGDPANVSDPSGLDPVDPNTGERSEVMGCHHTEKLSPEIIGWVLILLDIADFPSGEGIGPGIAMVLGRKGKGFTGGISKTVKNIKIGKNKVRVDVEYPTGGSIGNVHIQVKGPNKAKIYLDSIDDLQNLPKSIRNNREIQEALQRAFEQLSKARQ